jgi:DNA-binding LacI/PurR family transcriptional regulator
MSLALCVQEGEGGFSSAQGYAAMRQVLLQKPKAVFVASDMMAVRQSCVSPGNTTYVWC